MHAIAKYNVSSLTMANSMRWEAEMHARLKPMTLSIESALDGRGESRLGMDTFLPNPYGIIDR